MSLNVIQVIERALRMLGGLEGGGVAPSANDGADYFLAFNTLKRAMFGTFIGPRLSTQSPTGTAAQGENGGLYVIPANAFTLTLPANPKGGARVGVLDANNDFATFNCVVARGGRLLEGGAANLTLPVNGTSRQWWYRPDTGNWVREADFVTLADAIEFPDPLVAYLPYMLAVVIASEEGADIRGEVAAGAQEGREAFARSYGGRGANGVDMPVGLAPAQAAQGQG